MAATKEEAKELTPEKAKEIIHHEGNRQALLKWVQSMCSPQDVQVNSFKIDNWKNGVAFGALLNCVQKGLVLLSTLKSGEAHESLVYVLSMATNSLGISIAPSPEHAAQYLEEAADDEETVISYVLQFYTCYRDRMAEKSLTSRQRRIIERLKSKHEQLLRLVSHTCEELSRSRSYSAQLIHANERVRFEKEYANEQMEIIQDSLKSVEKDLRIEKNLRADAERELQAIRRNTHRTPAGSSSNEPTPKNQQVKKTGVSMPQLLLPNQEENANSSQPDVLTELRNARRALLQAHQERIFLKRKLAEEYQTSARLQEELLGVDESFGPQSARGAAPMMLSRANTAADIRLGGSSGSRAPLAIRRAGVTRSPSGGDSEKALQEARKYHREVEQLRLQLDREKKSNRELKVKNRKLEESVAKLEEDVAKQSKRCKKDVEKYQRRYETLREQLSAERDNVDAMRKQLRKLRLNSRSAESMKNLRLLADPSLLSPTENNQVTESKSDSSCGSSSTTRVLEEKKDQEKDSPATTENVIAEKEEESSSTKDDAKAKE